MVQAVLENLRSRQIEVKTGEVKPGDGCSSHASNRKLEPQAFGTKLGYHLTDGKLIFNARSETAAQKATPGRFGNSQKAKFGQHTNQPEELQQFEDYRLSLIKLIRIKPWYHRIDFKWILGID